MKNLCKKLKALGKQVTVILGFNTSLFSTLLFIYLSPFLPITVVYAIAVALSRVFIGAHYASDVLAGFSLGLAYLVLSINLIYKKMES